MTYLLLTAEPSITNKKGLRLYRSSFMSIGLLIFGHKQYLAWYIYIVDIMNANLNCVI